MPGTVEDYKIFIFVNAGDTCARIASEDKISLNDFVHWDTGVGGVRRTSLWANVYVLYWCLNQELWLC